MCILIRANVIIVTELTGIQRSRANVVATLPFGSWKMCPKIQLAKKDTPAYNISPM